MKWGDTMTSKTDIFENVVITTGIGVSLVDIQTILSICLLSFNIMWLCFKVCIKIYKSIKDGNLTPEEINDIDNDIDQINDKIKGGK